MVSTLVNECIFVKPVQFLNTEFPIILTESGKAISFSETQDSKALSSIVSRASKSLILTKAIQE